MRKLGVLTAGLVIWFVGWIKRMWTGMTMGGGSIGSRKNDEDGDRKAKQVEDLGLCGGRGRVLEREKSQCRWMDVE